MCEAVPRGIPGYRPVHAGEVRPTGLAQALDDGGVRHAAALAHRLQPIASAALLKCVDQRSHNACTASAQRVADETMRHAPIAAAALRTALEDVELAGVMIPAGTLVLANTAAANRDPAVYDDPARLDITREGAPPMQTFGAGMHYCLGANLARLELAEALSVMTRRMPNARRTGPAPWKPLTALSGPATLPIEFDTGH